VRELQRLGVDPKTIRVNPVTYTAYTYIHVYVYITIHTYPIIYIYIHSVFMYISGARAAAPDGLGRRASRSQAGDAGRLHAPNDEPRARGTLLHTGAPLPLLLQYRSQNTA